MKTIAIIPARYASVRFPGKLMQLLGDRTVLQRVWEQVHQCELIDKVVIATESVEIQNLAQEFGAEVIMTSEDHQSGTDRIYEAYTQLHSHYDYIINIQADEPFITSDMIQLVIEKHQQSKADIATPITRIHESEELFANSNIKVVIDANYNAMYFSRSVIPYYRDLEMSSWVEHGTYWKHIGLYSYTESALQAFVNHTPGQLELIEKLEQLRLLEQGFTYHCIEVNPLNGPGIDTPEDLIKAQQIIGNNE